MSSTPRAQATSASQGRSSPRRLSTPTVAGTLAEGGGGLVGGILPAVNEPSWGLRVARPDDREFLLRLNEATMREYVERVWGWDEGEQAALLEERFQPERWQIIQSRGPRYWRTYR
jgi:hypothetical protein